MPYPEQPDDRKQLNDRNAAGLNRGIIVALLVGASLIAVFYFMSQMSPSSESVSFGEVLQDARAGEVDTLEVDGTSLKVTYVAENGAPAVVKQSEVGSTTDIAKFLNDQGVALTRSGAPAGAPAVNLVFHSSGASPWSTVLAVVITLAPILFLRPPHLGHAPRRPEGRSRRHGLR